MEILLYGKEIETGPHPKIFSRTCPHSLVSLILPYFIRSQLAHFSMRLLNKNERSVADVDYNARNAWHTEVPQVA